MLIPQLPRALWWSHNAYYQHELVNSLATPVANALDVGCGFGDLAAALASRCDRVDAVDRSEAMIELAHRTHPGAANWLAGDVLDESLPLRTQGYDLVTAVSSLHHMPLRPALTRLAGLVRPGGLLAIVGLHRPATPADFAMDAASVAANYAFGAWFAAIGRYARVEAGMPMTHPTTTLAEITGAARELTPGAVVRRRLFFRYSLLWRRPVAFR